MSHIRNFRPHMASWGRAVESDTESWNIRAQKANKQQRLGKAVWLASTFLYSAGCAMVCTTKPWSMTRSRGRQGSAWAVVMLGVWYQGLIWFYMGSLNLTFTCLVQKDQGSASWLFEKCLDGFISGNIRKSWNGLRSAFILGLTVWDSCKRFSLYCSWFKARSKRFHPADLKQNYQQHKRRTWRASDASIACT